MILISNIKYKQSLIPGKQISKRGFTLIELLVVISIIGILATLIMANFVGIRERARDAQRKSDINQIQKALELYKNKVSPINYPVTGNLWTDLPSGTDPVMRVVPHDPSCPLGVCSAGSGRSDYTYASVANSLQYTLWACLENSSDGQADAVRGITPPAACTTNCTSTSGICYSVTQP